MFDLTDVFKILKPLGFIGKIEAVYLYIDAPEGLKPLSLRDLGELRNGARRVSSWSRTAKNSV